MHTIVAVLNATTTDKAQTLSGKNERLKESAIYDEIKDFVFYSGRQNQ